MSNFNNKRGFTTFIKAEELGKCECGKAVFNDQLYVKEDEKVYHLSCYNMKKAKENE